MHVGSDTKALEKTTEILEKSNYLTTQADLASEKEVASVFENVLTNFGHVDCLINATGAMSYGAKSGDVSPTTWFSDFVRK
jgi:NADP-dependent 3-hydroxy acid dehydrogenase YdfG